MSKVIVATAISFKKKIFNTCDSHKDVGLIKFRLSHSCAASDSHAADTRNHNHCRVAFTGGSNIVYATKKASTTEILKTEK